jgi:hypothetical protein
MLYSRRYIQLTLSLLLCPPPVPGGLVGVVVGTDCFPEGYGKYKVKSSSWLGTRSEAPKLLIFVGSRTARDLEVLTAPRFCQSTL